MIISRSIILRMTIFQTRFVYKIKTQILCSITSLPLPPENRAVYEIMGKNTVERGRPQMTIWRMRIACRIPKVTNTHSEYVILIDFSTTTMVTRTPLNVTLYVYWLYCIYMKPCYNAYFLLMDFSLKVRQRKKMVQINRWTRTQSCPLTLEQHIMRLTVV